MEQLINTMLANTQIPQGAPAAKKGESSAQKDGFQKLLEQKQGSDAPQAAKQPEKAETPQKTQEAQNTDKPQETETPVQTAPKSEKELEEQMALAAMAMLQNPVVPVEQAMTPEVQAEAVADEIAPLAAEIVLTPETQELVPETEQPVLEAPAEEGEAQTVDQAVQMEELPQTIEAPEAARETEGRTVEVQVEAGEARDTETADTEENPEVQGAETEAPVFEDVKAVPVKVGEAPKAAETAETENIGNQIGPKLVEITSVTGESGGQSVTINLDPANLGKLQIEVGLSKDGTLYVHVNAENSRTQNLLSRNSESLAAILGKYTQQEVQVEVPRQEESQRQDLYEQQQEHHQQRQQEQRRKQEHGEDFLQQLRLGLIPLDGE